MPIPGRGSSNGSLRQRTGLPLPRQRELAQASVASPGLGNEPADSEAFQGWAKTWAWTLTGAFIYVVAGWLLEICLPGDPLAYAELSSKVPLLVYQMSSTAFFTALVLNLTSVLFEDNATKRQLALLSCAIKGAACHTDMLLVTGRATVVFDAFGTVCIPQHYVQWLVTTPTMVYILSKISDFTPAETASAISMDVLMVLTGLWANFLPGPYLNWMMFSISTLCFVGLLYMMGRMVFSAVRELTSPTSRRSLLFIYMCTLFIWSLFPFAWILHVMYRNPTYGEYLTVFANFMAKVLFSSSIMYGNYMTIAQRRLLAQQEAENAHRVRMIAELRDAVTRKDQFMSLMSHELRTPLNGIIQLSDALVRGAGGEMNPKGQHFVKTIKNSSNHLLNIINDILDVAALKEGKLTIKHELCSLAKAVDHVVDIVAPLAKKEVVIERHVDPRTPLVIADFSRVIQILYNLTGNALKFTHKGRVSVHVAPCPDGSSIRLQVSDTGIGIPADRINGIWGAFEQVDMSVTRKYGGTGLGLNIVKQLVEAHDGSIEVHSMEGQGTTFTVVLPVLQSNTRQSLEVQVVDSLNRCGHGAAKEVMKKRSRRLSAARPGSLSGGIEEAISNLARGVTRRASGYLGSKNQDVTPPESSMNGGSSQEREEVLYRRRTQELERENFMGELQRRTEHKRSMEESQLASRQLELSGQERRAERDSRSLERLEEQIAARVGAPGGSRIARSGPVPLAASGGGSGGGAAAWRADAREAALASVRSRHSIDRSSMCTAEGNDTASDSNGGGVARGGYAGSRLNGGSLGDGGEHPHLVRVSNDSYGSSGGPAFARKLSNVSVGGKPPQMSSGLSLRMSAFGRNGGASGAPPGGAGPGGPGGGGSHSFSGPVGALTNSGGSSHMLLKSALESELYRTGRYSLDETSSVGADSESDVPRGARRHHAPSSAKTAHHARSAAGKLQAAARSGSSSGLGHGLGLGGSASSAAAATAAPPPSGLTLDKLSYSDMYGSIQILSVDDEEVNQIVLEEILTSSGYHFARCMDGLEALEWLVASDTMPDLILLDCMMPNMSGHEFCATLRRVIPGNVLPVIMVSAKSDEDNIVEGLRSGSNDFVRKPYQREELLARIETQLRLKNDSWWLAELVNNVDGRETESMKLLKNILPESIIARMQQGQKFVADSHSHVVILFSDIVGFTNLSSKLPSAEVFLMLSNMFTAFDKLTDRFSVYKVETIGDAYMVAAGHDEDDDKAKKGSPLLRVLGFARAMLDVVRNITAPNGERMRIRIGVHCGPAFAGVIGMKCPRYCFLGDTVNTASRMESTGFPMCIHVSENVYRHHPNPDAELHEVGVREVKGKGRMRTFLVRVGSWEQALQDFAARQQAAAAAAVQQQQQAAQLARAQLHLAAQDAAQQQNQPAQAQQHHQHPQLANGPVEPRTAGGNADGTAGLALSHVGDTAATDAAGTAVIERSRDLLVLVPADSLDSHGCWSPGIGTDSAKGSAAATLLPSPSPLPQQQQQHHHHHHHHHHQPTAATGQRGGAGGGAGGSGLVRSQGMAGPAPAAALQEGCNPGGRVVHHLSTVTEETTSHPGSHPPSPVTSPPAAPAGGPAGAPTAAVSSLPPGHHMRLGGGSSGSCSGGVRSPLSRHQDSGSTYGNGSRLPPRSTFGSEAYYCEDSSEDGALGGVCTITGMLRSRSGSLSGMVSGGAAAAALNSNSGGVGGGDGGGGGGRMLGASGATGAAAVAAVAVAAADGDLSRGGSVSRSGGAAAVAAAAVAADDPQFVQQVFCTRTALAAQGQVAYPAEEGGGAGGGAGAGAGVALLPSTVVYLEQRISSLATQLAAEAAAKQKLQEELDAERRRAATALQQASALQRQVRSALSAQPPSLSQLPEPASAPATARVSIGASDILTGPGGWAGPTTPPGTRSDEALLALSAAVQAGPGGAADADGALPFVLGDLGQRVALAAATARASEREDGRRGPRPPSGVMRTNGLWLADQDAEPLLMVPAESRRSPSASTTGLGGSRPVAALVSSTLYAPAVKAVPVASVSRRLLSGISLELKLVSTTTTTTTTLASTTPTAANGAGGGGQGGDAAWVLPGYGLEQLFEDLGLVPYLPRFQEEAIRLDMLLEMDMAQLEKLGLRPLGYCIRLREAVIDLARGLLRACEEAALLAGRDLGAAAAPRGAGGSSVASLDLLR